MASYAPVQKNIATQIGYLVIAWSDLEYLIDLIIVQLSGIQTKEVSDILLAGSDIRAKVSVAKGLITLRDMDATWSGHLTKILDQVANEFRNKRNTAVHSAWHEVKGKIIRRQKKVRMKKNSSFSPLTLSTEDEVHVTIKELREFVSDMQKAAIQLIPLFSYSGIWIGLDEETTAISYEQFLRSVKIGSRQTRIARKPAYRPRSS